MSSTSRSSLATLFRPKSIALIGGSDRNSYSHLMSQNLLGVKFDGSVFVVNKRGVAAHGYAGVTSVNGDSVEALDALLVWNTSPGSHP